MTGPHPGDLAVVLAAKIEEISTISVGEWIKIRTTLFVIANQHYVCALCIRKHAGKRKDWEAQLAREQEAKSCRTEKEQPFVNIDEQIFFKTCPGNFSFPEVLGWRDAFAQYRQGVLPFPGALMDQPNKVIEMFRVFESEELDRKKAEQKRRKEEERLRRMRG